MSEIDAFERRIGQKNATSTAGRYAHAVQRFESWLNDRGISFGEVDSTAVEDHLLYLAEERDFAKGTLTVTIAAISRFYQDSRKYDYNPTEPINIRSWEVFKKGSKKSHELRGDKYHYLQPTNIQKLVDNVPSPTFRNELIVRLLYQTGIRVGELVNIRLRDVDTDMRRIQIYAEKTHQNRDVYYQPSLDTHMNLWIDAERNAVLTASDSQYLFPTQNSTQISTQRIRTMLHEAANDAELQESLHEDCIGREWKKITPHTLRHSYAVASLKGDMDIRTLQKLMGHSNISTTEQYLDLADDDIRERAAQYGPSLESS